jgi:hypothetical protein
LSSPESNDDAWRWPAFLLWLVLLTVGMFPETFYFALRRAGDVTTQSALVNSPFLLYWGLVAFVSTFVYGACRTDDASSAPVARARAFTAAVVAMMAFLPVQMEALPQYFQVMPLEQRNTLLTVAAVKFLAWLYLFGLLLRYYLGDGRVFHRLPSLLPSVWGKADSEPEGPVDRA